MLTVRKTACLVLVIGASVAVALSSADVPSGAASSAGRIALGSGFVVARGTSLVGTVFPTLDEASNVSGWSAVLTANTDAASAMNAYQDQAASKDYRPFADQPAGCWTGQDGGEVLCHGYYYGPKGSWFGTVVRVCRSCQIPISEVQVEYRKQASGPVELGEIAPLVVTGYPGVGPVPTARLTRDERSRMMRTPGAADSGFSVEPGSRLLVPPSSFDSCQPDLVGVVEVTGKPQRVQDRYTRSAESSDSSVTHARIGTQRIRQVSSDYTTSTLVRDQSLRRPVLMVKYCSD